MDARKTVGLWLLPTRGRVHTNLPRFFAAAKKTGMSTPVAVIVEEDDYAQNHEAYDELDMPAGSAIHTVKGGCCAAATEQALRELCDGMQWIGWLADDLLPETDGWDVKCIDSLTGWNFVSTNEGRFAPEKANGATVWSGDLVRAVGYLYPPGFRHFYIDTVWEELGRLMNVWTCRMDIMVRHDHVSYNTDKITDLTARHTHGAWVVDETAFFHWKNTDCLAAANRIGELLIQYGVSKALPDLTGIHALIATPSGSGKYERLYVSSLFSTIEALKQCKAEVNLIELPYCSDIALARAKLFGLFLRSEATHMLFIDDDMAWQASDVIKLFAHNRDFVAVAGPRKIFPPSFAVQVANEAGKSTPLKQEVVTGLIEVSHIGMAFALITREVAVRLSRSHPELEFAGDDGRIEHAVFNPMVLNRKYMSEDYSFCTRWRALGGKIYCDPAISLKHVGTFVWSGAWQEQLFKKASERAAA